MYVTYCLHFIFSFTHDIEAVSCDEMFVDLTELLQSCQVSPLDFTTYLRERVQVRHAQKFDESQDEYQQHHVKVYLI